MTSRPATQSRSTRQLGAALLCAAVSIGVVACSSDEPQSSPSQAQSSSSPSASPVEQVKPAPGSKPQNIDPPAARKNVAGVFLYVSANKVKKGGSAQVGVSGVVALRGLIPTVIDAEDRGKAKSYKIVAKGNPMVAQGELAIGGAQLANLQTTAKYIVLIMNPKDIPKGNTLSKNSKIVGSSQEFKINVVK